jgi:ADP-ribose pyrophosphatase
MSGRRPIHKGRIVDLGLETTTLPNGRTVELEIIRHPGASAVVPVHDDGTVTLVYQHRHAAGGMIYEVPAGCLEPGEDPAECAKRELAEEVQLQADRMIPLGPILTTPGFTDERIWLFRAEGLRPSDAQPEDDEYIEVVRISVQEALAMCRDGRIVDGKTICALHLACCR